MATCGPGCSAVMRHPSACIEPPLGGLVSSKCSALKNNQSPENWGHDLYLLTMCCESHFHWRGKHFPSTASLSQISYFAHLHGTVWGRNEPRPRQRWGAPCPARRSFADPCSVVGSNNTLVQGVCMCDVVEEYMVTDFQLPTSVLCMALR